jgi:predicted amidohydrolase YtcJ
MESEYGERTGEGLPDTPADEDGAEKGISRKTFIAGTAAAGAALGLGATGAAIGARKAPATPTSNADKDREFEALVLRKGKIHTMDGSNRVVREILVRNGRIAEVGEHVDRHKAKVIDLEGRTVVPGIIDNHNHIVLMGNRPGYHTPLENAYSVADVQQTYAARASGIPAGGWITTIGGFHPNHFAELRLPTRNELDAAVPNNPVYISQSFSGPSTTNSLGKAFFEAADPPVTVGDNGSIAGGFGDSPTGRATLALRRALLSPEQRRRGAIDAIAYGLGLGVTAHLEQGAFQKTDTSADGAAHEDNYTMQLPFLELHKDGLLKARVQINFLHMESDPALPGLKQRLLNQFQFFGDDMLMTGGIGEFVAQGLGPTWQEAARLVGQAGWRAEVHSLTTSDFMTEISGYELVNAEFDITDLRWVVAHVPRITLEWINRLKAIGGGLSLTGWQYLAGNLPTTAPQYAGPPFRLIVDSGIPAGMSSDGMQIAPMNPWLHMYYATTGLNARGLQINPGQQISREEVLRLYTSRNGWFLRKEDELGSLEPGKLADLAVLNKDYFSVPDLELKQIRSALTLVGGEIVHNDGSIKV